MNKRQVQQAITRLESQALHWEGYHGRGPEHVSRDARRIRAFLNSERQQILVLRRYVHFGASKLEEFGVNPSEIMEMREAAKPTRRPK